MGKRNAQRICQIETLITSYFVGFLDVVVGKDGIEFTHQGHAQTPDADLLVEELEVCKHTIAYHQGQVDYASKVISMLMVGEEEEGGESLE